MYPSALCLVVSARDKGADNIINATRIQNQETGYVWVAKGRKF